MEFQHTDIDGILLVNCLLHKDSRGVFSETFRQDLFNQAVGEDIDFVQDNQSFSGKKHTVRGLHCQVSPHAQGKLVQCSSGRILDVVVDIRKQSETFGQSLLVELNADSPTQLWVPPGFLHGFVTLEPDTIVQYKCTDYYAPEYARTVYFDDPELGIDWGFDTSLAVLSKKDKCAPGFKEFCKSL